MIVVVVELQIMFFGIIESITVCVWCMKIEQCCVAELPEVCSFRPKQRPKRCRQLSVDGRTTEIKMANCPNGTTMPSAHVGDDGQSFFAIFEHSAAIAGLVSNGFRLMLLLRLPWIFAVVVVGGGGQLCRSTNHT